MQPQLLPLPFLLLLLSLDHNVHRGLADHAADAPAPATSLPTPSAPVPKTDVISIMSRKGCKAFAGLLTAGAGDNAQAFRDSVDGGLTVFCPTDDAVKAFLPKYKNLTADGKSSLLLFHGIPVYNSIAMLKSSNGVVNTLATDGTAKNFNFTVQNDGEIVTLESAGPKADIKSTLYDKDPLAVYSIDEVLEPLELFKPAEVPAPAPAPDTAADAPEAGKKKMKGKHAAARPPADGPDASPADQKAADDNAGGRVLLQRWTATAAASAAALMIVA